MKGRFLSIKTELTKILSEEELLTMQIRCTWISVCCEKWLLFRRDEVTAANDVMPSCLHDKGK